MTRHDAHRGDPREFGRVAAVAAAPAPRAVVAAAAAAAAVTAERLRAGEARVEAVTHRDTSEW